MKDNHESAASASATLLNDLRALVADAEKMIGASNGQVREEAFGSLHDRLGAAQECLSGLYAGTRKKLAAGARQADETIRANPYQAMALAAGIGLLIGVLAGRSSK
jgi:ElaB/YqjD/DUF883 family membrane-anchored ribosome-binding protein